MKGSLPRSTADGEKRLSLHRGGERETLSSCGNYCFRCSFNSSQFYRLGNQQVGEWTLKRGYELRIGFKIIMRNVAGSGREGDC